MSKFIVRYGGSWDNPKIAFVTDSEEIAKEVIRLKKQQQFDKNQEWNISWTNSRKARYNLSKLLLADPRTKEILGEEEFKHLEEEVENETKSWEHSEKKLTETIEDFEYHNWYYEEVQEINSIEEAINLPVFKDEYI